MGVVTGARGERRVRLRLDAVVVALGALVVLAAVLRFTTLSSQSYWIDETVTAARLKGSFYDTVAAFHRPDESEGPLYFVVGWLWARVLGTDEFGLRSLSALLGIATVPVAFETGRMLVNRRVGLAVAALVAVSPVMIWYSQEARAYALFILLSALSFLCFVRLLESPRAVNYAGWSIASSLALVTHYFAVFPIVGEAAWLLLRRRSRQTKLAVGGICLTAVAISPFALYQAQHGGGDWAGVVSLGRRLGDVGRVFVTGVPRPPHGFGPVLLILFACAVAIVMVNGRSRARRAASIALAVSAVTIGLALLGIAVGADYFFFRNVIAVWIPLAVAVASLTGVPGWRPAGLVLVAIMCGAFLYYDHAIATTRRIQRDDWRHVPRVLGPPNEARIVVVTPWIQETPLAWYEPCLRRTRAPQAVRVVDWVGYYDLFAPVKGLKRPLRPGAPFRAVARKRSGSIAVTQFRAPRPTLVHPAALLEDGPSPSRVYLDPPRTGHAPREGGRCRAGR
jgi:mannosyltransferase